MTAGGVAILADGPLAWAIQSGLPPATGYATTELSINMVRRVPDEGQLVARGRLVHLGRRLGLSEVFVTDDAGRLIAHGTSRCVIFPPASDVPAPAQDVADVREQDDGWVAPFLRPARGAVLDQEIFTTRTGLELMRGLVSSELPLSPAALLLGARPIEAGEGTCTFSMPATGWLTSLTGLVLGGVTACLADFALGAAMHTTVPPGTAVAPTDLRVQFIRPAPGNGTGHRGPPRPRPGRCPRRGNRQRSEAAGAGRRFGTDPPGPSRRPVRCTAAGLTRPQSPRQAHGRGP